FKLPRNVVRHKGKESDGSQIKTRIRRVFRDREELPLVSNLADPITEALEHSEYLIVICSPRLNESMWCRKEIETFIQMHDREHVLAVLAEGEPETSFPEELLFREEEEYKSDGSVIYKKVPVEPLAADVRGSTHREMRRKIKAELLRLAAPMFDCNYDDLKQRHREQRMRKVLLTSVSASVVCLLIGLVSTAAALKIQHQSQQIKEGAQTIYEQSEVIEAQYEESRRRVTETQAREALGFLEEGNRMLGLAEGVMAYQNYLPELYTEEQVAADCPSQLMYSLTELLYLYENGTQIKPDRTLEAQSTIRYMKGSPKGSRLMAVGDSGRLTVWESLRDREMISIRPEGMDLSWECQVGFLSEDRILYPQKNENSQGEKICVQDLETKELMTYPCVCYEGVIPIPEKEAFLVVEEEDCYLVDADGETAFRLRWEQLEEGLYAKTGFESAQVVTEDGRILVALELMGIESDTALSDGEASGREGKRIAVLEYGDNGGEAPTAALYPVAYEYIGSLCLEEGSYGQGADLLYVTSNHSEKTDSSITTAGMSGRLQAFDLSGQEMLWSFDVQGDWLYDVGFAHKEGSSYLLCQKYSEAMLLDRRDGRLIDTFSFGSEVVKIGSYTNTDDFLAFTRDGTWHYLDTDYMEDVTSMTFSDCTSSNVKEFAIGDGYCITLPYGSNRITVYRTARGEGMEVFYEGEESYREARLSADGKLLAASRYDDACNTCVEMFDTAEKKKLWTYEDSAYYKAMAFGDFDGNGTESLLIVTGEAYHIIDPADGTVLRTVAFENSGLEYLGIDRNNGVLSLKNYRTLYGYRIADGELLYEDALSDGITAVCSERPFYAVASKETDSLLFYQMGEEKVYMDPLQDGIDVEYLETMFFDEDDDDLYLVYKDGRVVIYFVDWNTKDDIYFCDRHGRYTGLSEKMNRYEAVEGADFGILCGITDAYQTDLRKGQRYNKRSHIHGYLAYDAASETLYLHNRGQIYTSPLYSLEEIVDLAQKELSDSYYWWNYQEFVPSYLDDM
ncbi:MAG: toll/interleukin-1 receptor domain-containing protein, partial [Lachnospiraceae bacterium]|nr:toll/interleukin-1 receptor domain-containing protein [Lachnospiraceae bacterium]